MLISEIARKVGISRNTVYAKLAAPDLSPQMPTNAPREKVLDAYRHVIEEYLDEDELGWREQRHTARRIWQSLRDEHGVTCSESTVRHYVHNLKAHRGSVAESYLDLVWNSGEAQADFGEADFMVVGAKRRMSFLVPSFPFSNMGFARVFPSENAECVRQALKQIFECVGGVPARIVFDNATGVGRRVCDKVRTTEIFTAFTAHYGFAFSFCNPYSGHKKGNIESKVRHIRSNLFVPVPRFHGIESFNRKLLGRRYALSKPHYLKSEDERQPFVEDNAAMAGLPEVASTVVRYAHCKADQQGKICVDGPRRRPTAPSLADQRLIVGLGATAAAAYTESGEFACERKRRYDSALTDTTSPASQLPLLTMKLGAWQNSDIRDAIPDDLRDYMDGLGRNGPGSSLKTMRDHVDQRGWDAAVGATEAALWLTGRLNEANVAIAAARAEGGSISYDEPVDLSVYDVMLERTAQDGD